MSYTIRAGMTRPKLTTTVTTSGGSTVDLNGATAVLYVSDGTDLIVDGASMTIDNASAGIVSYAFTALQSATPGNYRGQIEITYSDGGKERTDEFDIVIERAL